MSINEHKKMTLETEFGQRISVERERLDQDLTKRAGQELRKIGESLQQVEPALAKYEYVGTAAVHIYFCRALQQVDFLSQLPLGNASAELASKALIALTSDAKVAYGNKRQTKRSGF